MKDPLKVKAGKARWKNVSKKDMKKHLSNAGKKGGAATAKKWKELQAK